jgi:hypothetical protein
MGWYLQNNLRTSNDQILAGVCLTPSVIKTFRLTFGAQCTPALRMIVRLSQDILQIPTLRIQ